MSLKRYLTVVGSTVLLSCAHAGGGRPPRDVKVYVIYGDTSYCNPVEPWCQGKVGLVRRQAQQVIPFEEANEYFALTPDDFNKVIQGCPK